MSHLKLKNPSANRNSEPILKVLKTILSTTELGQKLLDIASGTGQHAAYFASHFPNITFQPSEYDQSMLPSIQAYASEASLKNICSPMHIDIEQTYQKWGKNPSSTGPYLDGVGHRDFKDMRNSFDYILNINMIHISPIECTVGLFCNASALLKQNGLLITYGAYAVDGHITPQSNVDFDQHLKALDTRYGIRDLRMLKEMAKEHGIEWQEVIDMPANNKVCVWKKIE